MITMENALRFGNKSLDLQEYLNEMQSHVFSHGINNEITLSRRKLAYVQSYAESEMLQYDYSLWEVNFSTLDWIQYAILDWPINFAGGLAYKLSASNSMKFLSSTRRH